MRKWSPLRRRLGEALGDGAARRVERVRAGGGVERAAVRVVRVARVHVHVAGEPRVGGRGRGTPASASAALAVTTRCRTSPRAIPARGSTPIGPRARCARPAAGLAGAPRGRRGLSWLPRLSLRVVVVIAAACARRRRGRPHRDRDHALARAARRADAFSRCATCACSSASAASLRARAGLLLGDRALALRLQRALLRLLPELAGLLAVHGGLLLATHGPRIARSAMSAIDDDRDDQTGAHMSSSRFASWGTSTAVPGASTELNGELRRPRRAATSPRPRARRPLIATWRAPPARIASVALESSAAEQAAAAAHGHWATSSVPSSGGDRVVADVHLDRADGAEREQPVAGVEHVHVEAHLAAGEPADEPRPRARSRRVAVEVLELESDRRPATRGRGVRERGDHVVGGSHHGRLCAPRGHGAKLRPPPAARIGLNGDLRGARVLPQDDPGLGPRGLAIRLPRQLGWGA